MISSLLKDLIMADATDGERVVFILCEWTAGTWVYFSIDRFLAGKTLTGICLGALAILFAVAGVKWPSLKLRLGLRFSRFAAITEQIASDYRYRTAGIIILTVGIMLMLSFYLHSIRNDLDTYVMPRSMTDKQANELREYLSHYEPHSVTVKFNSLRS